MRSPADIPFSPRRAPFYPEGRIDYHWVVLAAGTFGIIMSAPGQTIGVSAFTDYLIKALGVDRVTLSSMYMVGTIGSACLLPVAGWLYDKLGARVLVPIVSVGLGCVLVLLSRSDRIVHAAQTALGAPDSAAVLFAVMALLMVGLRFCGQGVMTVASRNMVMKWFRKRRGLASAIISVGLSVGFAASPKIYDWMIQAHGWRQAWTTLAAVAGIGFALLALLVYRDNPEASGLEPDGHIPVPETGVQYEPAVDYTLLQAIATPAFWFFNLGTAAFSLHVTAITFHITSIFESQGLLRETAMSIFLPGAALTILTSFASGILADRAPLKLLLAALSGGMALSAGGVMLLGVNHWAGIACLVIGNALAGGPFGIISSVTWARFYGRSHLGVISGVNMASAVFASALGPLLYATSKQYAGGYAFAAGVSLVVYVGFFLGSFFANNPSADGPRARVVDRDGKPMAEEREEGDA